MKKVVVITGAGISAESGLQTFRDSDGLWEQYDFMEVASIDGWRRHPEVVQRFYNWRREQAAQAQPNAAHRALAELQEQADVQVITQNVDDLHERAGSRKVLHLHGQLAWQKAECAAACRQQIGNQTIQMGQCCPHGAQWRPDVVWFGEAVPMLDAAWQIVSQADYLLVVGTSLSVYPAASLIQAASDHAHKVLVNLALEQRPAGFECIQETATAAVPAILAKWAELLE